MEQSVRTHRHLVSVTSDGDFDYVQIACGHVTCKRDGGRIVLIASGADDIITIAVSRKKDEAIAS